MCGPHFEKVILWCLDASFWASDIISTKKDLLFIVLYIQAVEISIKSFVNVQFLSLIVSFVSRVLKNDIKTLILVPKWSKKSVLNIK